ncbi:secretin N-terminal domain-containing protein [Hydrogenimonas cancrithermarum]|uniref:Pilus (MSHA type) biogenesis protein MshL n=1 Tax=Hydrogenimonas cancrithermarum TaxID=2993563 RepID=A0ABM8FKC9_9BACT|nr:secretin N-terminal domain-containing protein [Hydrogenimonas cancrithermarum]BDY12772.1 pilus (MSHA type) biogenesis protein MshL [Hydrogenimonas cancrithermarum]
MVGIVQIVLIFLLFAGCSQQQRKITTPDYGTQAVKKEIAAANERPVSSPPPPLVLPPVYQPLDPLADRTVSFTGEGVALSKLLYAISKSVGLNLVIDKDVPAGMPVTLTLRNASLKEALGVVMDISGCYYELKGSILHVKRMVTKTFIVPYVHMQTSSVTELGGDILGSAQTGSSSSSSGGSGGGSGQTAVSGKRTLKYSNPEEANDFYAQLEENVQKTLSEEGRYTLNRYSGVLTVHDTKKRVEEVESLVKSVMDRTGKQILIEAKILEVVLNHNHQYGVEWQRVFDNLANNGKLTFSQSLGLQGAVAGAIQYTSDNWNVILSVLHNAGDVETLSNPRIKVLNGQSALLSSGKLVPFWEKEVEYTAVSSGGSNTVAVPQITYNRRDVLDGIAIGVTPVIMTDGRIMLNIVPINSSIEDIVEYKDEAGNTVATAPIINMKEAGTTVFSNDNEIVVIGGLINTTEKNIVEGVPFLDEIPGVGALFRNEQKSLEKREMVILLKINVVR